jgi:hypothetical protein
MAFIHRLGRFVIARLVPHGVMIPPFALRQISKRIIGGCTNVSVLTCSSQK